MGRVAAEFPDTNFVVIDAVVDAPNVQSILFDEHTGSYLVGALAAMKSETGTVGFVGGMDVPLIHKFYCGYAQGAKSVNPDIDPDRKLHRHHPGGLERSGHRWRSWPRPASTPAPT